MVPPTALFDPVPSPDTLRIKFLGGLGTVLVRRLPITVSWIAPTSAVLVLPASQRKKTLARVRRLWA